MECSDIRDGFEHIDNIGKLNHVFKNNFENDRKFLKDRLVELFKSEKAGKGKGELATRVVYCVEKVGDTIVYLKRPAPLNNGFDFEVHTTKKLFFGRIRTRPSHECVFEILKKLKHENLQVFNQAQIIIDELYRCNEKNINSIQHKIGNMSVELLLKVIKWLFVEQDITYWSYSGREMLYNGLKNV